MTNTHNITGFSVRDDLVVLGVNPEMADYTNPRGHVYGVQAVVVAYNEHGDTFEHVFGSAMFADRIMPNALRFAEGLSARLACGKLPIAFDRWTPGRAVYGSDAYVQYGQAADVALERREVADEQWA